MSRRFNSLLTVVVVVSLALSPALVQAGTVTDDFESYAPEATWSLPTGNWTLQGGSPSITDTGGVGGSNSLNLNDNWASSGAYWLEVPDVTVDPEFTYSFDFNLHGTRVLSRNGPRIGGADPSVAYLVTGMNAGVPALDLLAHCGGSESFSSLPGQPAAADTWYTMEGEFNFNTLQVRARFGPQGGTPNGWTPWCDMYPVVSLTTPVTNFMILDATLTGTDGTMDLDNMSLTTGDVIPEPGTGFLLACGLALMTCLRRKQQ